uniref:YprB ribonuclease H-like domain-containing protein n=1 Tax=viral metagenome TaxID=1070528 RepID=A0A6C0KSF1_9ZZZZ
MDSNDNDWVTPSSIRNYILDDTLCDWLETKKDEFRPEVNPAIEKIMHEGIQYEEQVLTFLKEKYGTENVKTVAKNSADLYNTLKYEQTLSYMKEKVPIIYQGVLVHFGKKIGGICDLLVLSTFFNKIVGDNQGIAFINDKREHYVVIDIKCSRLSLTKDGIHLQNSRNYTFYKGQLYMYTEALKHMQNYDPIHAYILGNGWEFTRDGQKTIGNNALQRMAKIDFHYNDNFIISRVDEALAWVRRVRSYGDTWLIFPPSIPELRPNMKVQSAKWQHVKKDIAEKQEDVTLLYQCGEKKRVLTDEQSIDSWKNVRSVNLNVKSRKIRKSIDRSVTVNCSENFVISPRRFSQIAKKQLVPHKNELYVDYETFYHRDTHGDITSLDLGETVTYMIGCGFVRNNTWTFKTYILDSLLETCKENFFNLWLADIREKEDIQIYSWGPTEKNLFEKVTGNKDVFTECKYTDLLKVFRDESVAVTGLHGYSLKNIAKAMHKGGCITTIWPENNEVKNGLDAMQEGKRLYLELSKEERYEKLQSVTKYNEVDCKVMWEIVSYFRENHF